MTKNFYTRLRFNENFFIYIPKFFPENKTHCGQKILLCVTSWFIRILYPSIKSEIIVSLILSNKWTEYLFQKKQRWVDFIFYKSIVCFWKTKYESLLNILLHSTQFVRFFAVHRRLYSHHSKYESDSLFICNDSPTFQHKPLFPTHNHWMLKEFKPIKDI